MQKQLAYIWIYKLWSLSVVLIRLVLNGVSVGYIYSVGEYILSACLIHPV